MKTSWRAEGKMWTGDATILEAYGDENPDDNPAAKVEDSRTSDPLPFRGTSAPATEIGTSRKKRGRRHMAQRKQCREQRRNAKKQGRSVAAALRDTWEA